MKALTDFADSIAIVVSSCDVFFDAWRPFAFFFRKFWPDCPFPVYLITNELEIRSSFMRAIRVGPDRGWATNLKLALAKIDATRVLYLQEDYFFNGPVRPEQLADDLAYAVAHDVDAFCFRARSELEHGFQPLNDRFGIVPPVSDGRTRCQLTLWKRDSFASILREGENAWEMEALGSERTRDMKILSYSTRDSPAVPYLMSAIVRGLWTPEALTQCATAGVELKPQLRGSFSSNQLLQRYRRAQSRRRLRRALRKNNGRPIELDPSFAKNKYLDGLAESR